MDRVVIHLWRGCRGDADIPTDATTFAVGIRVANGDAGDFEDYEWQFTGYELYHSFV